MILPYNYVFEVLEKLFILNFEWKKSLEKKNILSESDDFWEKYEIIYQIKTLVLWILKIILK